MLTLHYIFPGWPGEFPPPLQKNSDFQKKANITLECHSCSIKTLSKAIETYCSLICLYQNPWFPLEGRLKTCVFMRF